MADIPIVRRVITGFVSRIASASVLRPWATIACFLIAAALSSAYMASTLKVDTDPGLMISNEPKFSRDFQTLIKQFPILHNAFVVLIETDEAERGRELATEIAGKLSAQPDLFSNVHAPGTGAFFDKNGVLYLSKDQVAKIASDLEGLAPLLNTLSIQPDVAGLDDLLQQIVPVAEIGQVPEELARLLQAMAETTAAETSGKSRPLDWSGLSNKRPEPENRLWLVFAKPVLDYTAIDAAGKPMAAVRQMMAGYNSAGGGVKVQLTGDAALDAEEFESVSKGALLAGLTSFALVTLTIVIGFPVLSLVIPALALLVLGLLLTGGFAALTIGYLNMISVAFAVLFIGLGIDYAVHVILRFAEERAKGSSRVRAAQQAAALNALPLTLCTATTSLAFLSFLFTEFVGMAQLGVIAAGGVVIAYLASISLVPAILAVLPDRGGKLKSRYSKLAGAGSHEPRPGAGRLRAISAIFIIAAAVIGIFSLEQARFDSDPLNLKDKAAPSMIAFKRLSEELPGQAYAIQYVSQPGEELQKLLAKLRVLPEVSSIRTVERLLPERQKEKLEALNKPAALLPADILPSSEMPSEERREYFTSIKDLAGRIAAAAQAPESVRTAADKLQTNLEMALRELPSAPTLLRQLELRLLETFPSFFNDVRRLVTLGPISIEDLPKDLKDRYVTSDGRWRVEILPSGNMSKPAEFDRFVSAVSALHPDLTGAPVDIKGSADVVAQAMRTASVAALFLVCLVLYPALRSIRDVLLVLAPLVLAGLLVMAYSVNANAPFNFANVIVLPLLIGLGVDSAIHYVLRSRDGNARTDVGATWTPRAVLISAVTTMCSFGTLWLSHHRGLASMGELLSVSIVATLLCTLVALPQLIRWFDTRA